MENPVGLTAEERQRCEVWTRVMGYHRPVASFNHGKKSEHRERRHFVETKINRIVQRDESCTQAGTQLELNRICHVQFDYCLNNVFRS